MTILTLYRTDTGEITGQVSCTGAFAPPAGEAFVVADIDASRYYMVGGKPVEYPPRPHPYAEFDYAAGIWIDGRSLEEVKAEARAKVVAWASVTLSRFTADYPPEEVLSWSAKLPAARRVLAGQREVMIEIEARALGVPVSALAAKVVEKGGIYEAIAALAAAIRGKTQAGIDAAESVDQVDLVLAAALEEAKTTLASLGVA